MSDTHQYTLTRAGHRLAYRHLKGRSPGILFLPGFKSDMTGAKAEALRLLCAERGQQFTVLDYYAHGSSEGDFLQGSIGRWKADVLHVLDHITEGPQILIGSSMGGWLMLLAALERRARVAGLVGIAAAPDFTENLIWERFSASQRETLEREGVVYLPSCYGEEPYPMTKLLIEEAREHLILPRESLPLDCPVSLIHGMQDEDVPWHFSIDLSKKLASARVRVLLDKEGGHRMSEPEQLRLMLYAVAEMLEKCPSP